MTDKIKLSNDAIDEIIEHTTTVIERDKYSDDSCHDRVVQTLIKIQRERLEKLNFDRSCIIDNVVILTVKEAEQLLTGMYQGTRGVNPQRDWLEYLIAKATGKNKK